VRTSFSCALLVGSPLALPETEGALDPAGDGGATDDVEYVDMALSARLASAGASPEAGERPV